MYCIAKLLATSVQYLVESYSTIFSALVLIKDIYNTVEVKIIGTQLSK